MLYNDKVQYIANFLQINQFLMEDFIAKRNYLYHLKQISAIKNGQNRHTLAVAQSSQKNHSNLSTFRQNHSYMNRTQNNFATRRKKQFSSPPKKSTEQIMKNFVKQKENLRLVGRIGSMTPQINMRKLETEFAQNRKIMRIHTKFKPKKQSSLVFRFYDIKFSDLVTDCEELFSIYEIQNHKKRLITKGNIFDLRKKEIKTSKNEAHTIKIIGERSWGTVSLEPKQMLSIRRNKQQVGSLVIDIVKV